MREIKIKVSVNQEGQSRKYGDSEYRYRVEVEGVLSDKKVFRFCRECLNGAGISYEEWNKSTIGLQDKNDDISIYFNGYYKFSQTILEQDKFGTVTKAIYDYSVTIPYCD
jgi:hypothetical protein